MIHIGTSGYNYPEWRGSFYPEGFPTSKMLAYYSERFGTMEINYSFYRLPSEKALDGWAEGTPDNFIFTLKAPRRITHDARLDLERCGDLLTTFLERAKRLGPKEGVFLFQLAPYFRKDTAKLDEFLSAIPDGHRIGFEFRHTSWHSEDVFDILRQHNAALCITDSESLATPVEATASHGYFRLRDEGYEERDIERWANTILERQGDWQDIFIYFKHEEQGKGPEFARMLEAKLQV